MILRFCVLRMPDMQNLSNGPSKPFLLWNGLRATATLVAVLCLALFEAVSLPEKQEMTSWNAHINGAAALLELRGSKQFDSWLGRKLYLHASHSISASCAIKEMRAPAALLDVDKRIPSDDPKYFLAARRGRLLRRIAEYRQKKPHMTVKERLFTCKTLLEDIEDQMAKMNAVDSVGPMDASLMRGLPESARIYTNGADLYSSVRWAQAWNILRMLRLFMSDTVCGWLDVRLATSKTQGVSPNGTQDEELESIRKIRRKMAERVEDSREGILRSVPYFLYMSGEPRFTARSLIGPLYATASVRLITPRAKEYAIDCLYYIAREYGFDHAVQAAKSVDDGSNFDLWCVFQYSIRLHIGRGLT